MLFASMPVLATSHTFLIDSSDFEVFSSIILIPLPINSPMTASFIELSVGEALTADQIDLNTAGARLAIDAKARNATDAIK